LIGSPSVDDAVLSGGNFGRGGGVDMEASGFFPEPKIFLKKLMR
jgi:hypothetical protein